MKIVVIGGGVCGLSIGWRLAQAGAEVTLLERAQPGAAATWAAAGMLSATAEHGGSASAETQLARRSAELWPDFAAEIEAASGTALGYSRSGTLMVAQSEVELSSLTVRYDGAAIARLSAAEARAREPILGPDIAGALFDPGEAQVDNRALGPALAIAFRRAGGRLLTNEPVVRVEADNGRATGARTPFALHQADAFIVAAGAWSGEILGLPAISTKPMKGEMIALVPPSGVPLPTHMLWGNDVYLVSRHGRLLVGATVEDKGFDTRPSPAARDWLHERATGLIPVLEGWALAEHWAGLRPGSPDGLPLLGRTALEGVFVASGQFRNGILFAPAIADAMRGLVLEQRQLAREFDPGRFEESRLP